MQGFLIHRICALILVSVSGLFCVNAQILQDSRAVIQI
jgi:hypothetical protein